MKKTIPLALAFILGSVLILRYFVPILEPVEAYALASVAADLKIAEVVDVPHMLVSMKIAKEIFGGE